MTTKFLPGDRVQINFSRSSSWAEVYEDYLRGMTGIVLSHYWPDNYIDAPYYTVLLDGNEWGGFAGLQTNVAEHLLSLVDRSLNEPDIWMKEP